MKLLLYILLINFTFANIGNIKTDRILFCLNQNIDPLIINKFIKDNKSEIKTNLQNLNDIIDSFNIQNIEPWLPGATENDNDGNIYLNKIYRIIFNNREISEINNLKESLESLNSIHSTEYEYKRRPFYTPNDQYYSQQWFLPAINSNDAWNLWTNSNQIPGDRNVILASVDLGVNYAHADIRNNLWQNLNEDADVDLQIINNLGQLVKQITYNGLLAGTKEEIINVSGLSSGIYEIFTVLNNAEVVAKFLVK